MNNMQNRIIFMDNTSERFLLPTSVVMLLSCQHMSMFLTSDLT